MVAEIFAKFGEATLTTALAPFGTPTGVQFAAVFQSLLVLPVQAL
jgi:hypothetical protein